jgi:hypothetical protein
MYTSVTDWLIAIGTLVTAGAAGYASITWRQNLRKASQHEIATKVLEEASLFRYMFYESRAPIFFGYEFPASYHAIKDRDRSHDEEADGWLHVFEKRWKIIGPQMAVLARLRGRARILLGNDVANNIEVLARTGYQLQSYMREKVAQYRAGSDVVAQWADQNTWCE